MHDSQGPEQVGGGAVGRWGNGVRWEAGTKGSKTEEGVGSGIGNGMSSK